MMRVKTLMLAASLACVGLLQCTGTTPKESGPGEPVSSGTQATASGSSDEGAVSVEHDPSLRETKYTSAIDECRISWVVYGSQLNQGLIHHRSECSLSLSEQVLLIRRILHRVLEDAGERDAYHTFFWGRLYPDGRPDPTLAIRLARAAKQSTGWDAALGVARTGDANGFVRRLANEALIYPELREVFRAAGLEVEVSAVEKVLVLPAGRLPFFEKLPPGEIEAAERLPYDCMTWFSIRRIQ
ncbi:MAG: hypothetical protein ABIG68_12570 [Acidobacteriota bacterium]